MVHQHQVIGNIICGYRLTEYLGGGGMGEVYLGVHPQTGEKAAIKFLSQLDNLDRFKNEALILSNIQHPGIARFIQFDVVDNTPLIVMEYVGGSTLGQLLKKYGKLDFETAQGIFIKIVEAVAVLHQQGIIHRDLKPGNIKITEEGEVKLLDFGIAKTKRSPKLTQTGQAVGTIQYMSYEQLKGNASQPTDVWSLGILYYEMLTGSLPFDSQNIFNLKELIKKSAYTSVRILNPDIPVKDEKLIAKCLKFKPEARYANASKLLKGLEIGSEKSGLPINLTLPKLSDVKIPEVNLPESLNPGALGKSLAKKFMALSKQMRMGIIGVAATLLLFLLISIFSSEEIAADSITIKVRSNVTTAKIYEGNALFGKTVTFPYTLTQRQGTKLAFKVKKEGYQTGTTLIDFHPNKKEEYISLDKER